MNKSDLIQKIITLLRDALAAGTAAARAISAAATDPDSKAENKYDTRNLEASYLARGQAFRVAETMAALGEFESLTPRAFLPDQAIAEGALVELRGADGTFYCFIGPAAGGTEITVDGSEVMVITPASPLGAKLMRRKAGEKFELTPGRPVSAVEIVSVT